MQTIQKIRHWCPTNHPPILSPGGLHIWRIRTEGKSVPLAELWPLLSQRESDRARSLRFDHHRERYVRAHTGLRTILSGYIEIEPQAILFDYAGTGKPALGGTVSNLEFNLTTSSDLALVAISAEQPVGIDCERVRDHKNAVAIARRMFTQKEADRIAGSSSKDRLEQFHIAWTALEAEVKADGRGLFGREEALVRGRVQVEHCSPEHGFIAAVARRELPPVEEWVALELVTD